MVNLHFSLLPRWRGAAPVERALLAGDAETGVCVMQVAEGLDTGDIYRTVRLPIGPDATLASLRAELVAAGAALLVEALGQGLGPGEPQVGEPVYAAKLETSDYRLDFERSALDLDRVIRLGGAWCTFRGRRLKIWRATLGESSDLQPGEVRRTEVGTATSSLELVEVQPEGRPRMAARDWANGAQPRADERLV
jgi:methionyl-tRNA formyltransferase